MRHRRFTIDDSKASLVGALGAQPVGTLEERLVVEHRDEAEHRAPVAPGHCAVPPLLVRDVGVTSVRDARAGERNLASGDRKHEDREQRAPLFVEEVCGRLFVRLDKAGAV